MRAVLQRVSRAEVRVEGAVVGAIGPGLLVLLGVEREDDEAASTALARKIARLRIFPSERHPIDSSLMDQGPGGEVLVVSQFTLCADLSRGNRPSFAGAAPPEEGERLYRHFCERLQEEGLTLRTGRFGAMMEVELVNDGPVTIVL